jgi:hypothetical protein
MIHWVKLARSSILHYVWSNFWIDCNGRPILPGDISLAKVDPLMMDCLGHHIVA